MSNKGSFFAIGKPQWAKACELGIRPASALLVLCCGTGRDNSTTQWSCEAVYKHTGMTWRRANDAIGLLEVSGLVSTQKGGARPVRKVTLPENGELIWLPNELVVGAGKEVPPVARLRQTDELDLLRLLIELYGEQELAGDGGLPRKMLRGEFEKERICGWGQFEVYGFKFKVSTAFSKGPFARYWDKGVSKNLAWERLGALQKMGLLEAVYYLAESDDVESELIHALGGDEYGGDAAIAAAELASNLPGGFKYEAERFDYVLPVLNHMTKAAVVGVYRLRYRPKTSRTAAWFARHVADCKKFSELYRNLAVGQFKQAS